MHMWSLIQEISVKTKLCLRRIQEGQNRLEVWGQWKPAAIWWKLPKHWEITSSAVFSDRVRLKKPGLVGMLVVLTYQFPPCFWEKQRFERSEWFEYVLTSSAVMMVMPHCVRLFPHPTTPSTVLPFESTTTSPWGIQSWNRDGFLCQICTSIKNSPLQKVCATCNRSKQGLLPWRVQIPRPKPTQTQRRRPT